MPLARYTCTGWLVLLLLFLMSSGASPPHPLTLVNPWLSSCDLRQPDSPTSCSTMISEFPGPPPPPPSCPPPCASPHSDNTTQCLEYLNESHKAVLCRSGSEGGGGEGGGGRALAKRLRLTACCEHSVSDVLSDEVLLDSAACERTVQAVLEVNVVAATVQCQFSDILSRYDCGQSYSVNFHCSHCQEAYRQWVCASLVPHWRNGRQRVKPCRTVCQRVEQKCPFFLPFDRSPAFPTQYAGEPTFLCLDPDIPETGEQFQRSIYSSTCCFDHCGDHKLCVTPPECVPETSIAPSEHCQVEQPPVTAPCASAAHTHRLSATLTLTLTGVLLLGHLIDRTCRKRTKISWK